MATPYYGDDAVGLGRYGYGGASYNQYGARQAAQARQYASGALPYVDVQAPYNPVLNASSSTLNRDAREVRSSRDRRRSLPPVDRRRSRRARHRSPSRSSRDDGPGNEDPVRKAHGLIKGAFSNSTSGLGVGVLGAIVGGLVAREASESATQGKGHGHRRRSYQDQERKRLLSTVLGAAVGGLGANAIEKRIEKARDSLVDKEEAWEKKWHRDSKGRTIGDNDDLDHDQSRHKSQRRSGEAYAR